MPTAEIMYDCVVEGGRDASLPDPRLRPAELYMAQEREAERRWAAGASRRRVANLADLRGEHGPLPISVPEGSEWDAIARYFHSVEELAAGADCDGWVHAWRIHEYKRSPTYADLLCAQWQGGAGACVLGMK
jgi:hypothetical protein